MAWFRSVGITLTTSATLNFFYAHTTVRIRLLQLSQVQAISGLSVRSIYGTVF
jgi:uncharacterized protein (DUF39 family)